MYLSSRSNVPEAREEKPANSLNLRKPIKEIYVAIDACAKLSGQPYAVLEALREVYKITGRSNLHYIDTEQGFHEKSDCTIPAFMNMLEPNKYTNFLQRNPEWTRIVTTSKCSEFREDLATKIIPRTVQPLMELAEQTSHIIQKKAFRLMQERNETYLDGKEIKKPEDIDIKINISEKNNPVFVGELLNEAADISLPFWIQQIDKIGALNSNERKYHKGFMTSIIKAMQETKAFSYELIKNYSPDKLALIENLPTIENSDPLNQDYRKKISEKSHLFADIKLPTGVAWWEQHEAIQALRMTRLWPWSLKENLSEESKGKLKQCHKNTADTSYLRLYTDILPKVSKPQNTLFILLTNDGPLIDQFLEASTGMAMTSKKEQYQNQKGQKSTETTEFKPSNVYNELGLTEREPREYPHQAAWAGLEFVRFAYKEVLDSIKNYLSKDELRNLSEIIDDNKSKNRLGDVHYILKNLLNVDSPVPDALKEALNVLLENTNYMEEFVSKDIQQHGAAARNGRYEYRKTLLMEKRNELQIA